MFNNNVGMGQQPSNQKIVKQTGTLDSSLNQSTTSTSALSSGASPRTVTPSTPNRNQNFTEVTLHDRSQKSGGTLWEASQTSLHKSPISDVPFKLGQLLQLTQQSRNNAFGSVGRITSFNVHAYQYDFELERSVIRDFNNSLD